MTEKWYRQFWPWFLVTIPLSSVLMGGLIVYIAITTEHAMVSDDYYKEGKAINVSLQKKRMAKQLGLVASLSIENDITLVKFKQSLPPDSTAITLDFFHATLEKKDFHIMLTRDANGVYRGRVPNSLNGKWNVTLTPYNQSWKIRKQINFPINKDVLLEP